jgi:hypothetical protein
LSNEDNRGATSANEAEGEYYTVQEGDCIDSLAQARGHVSETLWSHPRNTHLSRKGRTSNTLLAGDVLFIPAIRAKKHSVETGKKHSFVRRGIPIKLKLRILRSGKPRSREPFRLFASGRWITGITDEDGRLEVPVSPGATDAELYI